MREQLSSRARSELLTEINTSDDEIALRALTLRVFKAESNSIKIASLVAGLHFNPIALARALVQLETLGIINLRQNDVTKSDNCEREILRFRSKLIRVKGKAVWKRQDVRSAGDMRYVIDENS